MKRLISILLLLLIVKVSVFAQAKINKEKMVFEGLFFNALKEKSLENYEEALVYFQKCIQIDPKNPTSFYESSRINFTRGNVDLAIEQIQKSILLDPKNRWYIFSYAEYLFNNQDFKKAAIQYKKLIEKEPQNQELYFLLSEAYIYANEFKKAISVYNKLENYVGLDRKISIQKHSLYRQINDLKMAIYELEKILKAYPEDVQTMELLSDLYLLSNNKEGAFELFKKISHLNPENGRVHLTLADYYREMGDNKQSYQELKLAFYSKALSIDTKVRILISYYQLIGIDEALKKQAYELAEIMLEIHPQDIKARAVYADILYTDNNFEKAKQQYLLVLEQDKSKSQLWTQVLFIQAEQNDFENMLETSKEALEYFPLNPLFYYFNGLAKKWFKNYSEAATSFELGIDFIVDNQALLTQYYLSLADVYHQLEKHNLSDNFYEKVLKIDSLNPIALNNYSYYLSLRKTNLLLAKEMSYKCNLIEENNGTYQDTYAWVLYQLGEYEEAKKWIEKALKNGSESSPVVIEHYGDVLYKLGLIDDAVFQWEKAQMLGLESEGIIKKILNKELNE